MSKYPPLPVVDENDKIIGEAYLAEILQKGLRHRIAMVAVQEPSGKLLLQKRGLDMATNPGRWDVSAAGHVDPGEDYRQAAERELSEELGIVRRNLTEAAYYFSDLTLEGKHLRRFIKIYHVTVSAKTKFSPDMSEVSEVRWFEIPELKKLLEQGTDLFNNDLTQILQRLESILL